MTPVQLSTLVVNDCGVLVGTRFIVVERGVEDRGSGWTTVAFETGGRRLYVWDVEDPIVTYIGKGRWTATITWPEALP